MSINNGGGGIAFNNQGAWSATTAYNPGMVVQNDSVAYLNYEAIGLDILPQEFTSESAMTISTTNTTDDTATSTGGGYAIGGYGQTEGKWYVEFQMSSLGENAAAIRVAQAANAESVYAEAIGTIGSTFAGGGSGSFSGLSSGSGTHAAIAVDISNKLFWVCENAASPVWNGSGTADPATGTGGITMASGSVGTLAPAFTTVSASGQVCRMITDDAHLTGAAPSGFTVWQGIGDNPDPADDPDHWIG